MELQDIKYLFRNYTRYKKGIAELNDKLDYLRSQAEKITPNYSSEGGGGGKNSNSKVETAVMKMQEIEEQIAQLEKLVSLADRLLSRLKAHSRHLITEVYINNQTYEEVAEKEHLSVSNLHKMINRYFKQLMEV